AHAPILWTARNTQRRFRVHGYVLRRSDMAGSSRCRHILRTSHQPGRASAFVAFCQPPTRVTVGYALVSKTGHKALHRADHDYSSGNSAVRSDRGCVAFDGSRNTFPWPCLVRCIPDAAPLCLASQLPVSGIRNSDGSVNAHSTVVSLTTATTGLAGREHSFWWGRLGYTQPNRRVHS